ncbi:uncharacterized protein BT62DRAFT_1009303 [Guyanagaster necrorhizus]|uniref:Uncharacterized protein n=1 Tax=Guyanagaster necrorhizus TaxID=856835 RepID=A0A9P7VP90_9AGAR|nr:uncharacterized protein BT62DRAFT_1009303 [Guyanagaster necrorhizus MCA 3950]KAG7443489.1 hypothetical protein BT62DRAFT_1009303 [Guyanagaster necrorhizus MCA 3950]
MHISANDLEDRQLYGLSRDCKSLVNYFHSGFRMVTIPQRYIEKDDKFSLTEGFQSILDRIFGNSVARHDATPFCVADKAMSIISNEHAIFQVSDFTIFLVCARPLLHVLLTRVSASAHNTNSETIVLLYDFQQVFQILGQIYGDIWGSTVVSGKSEIGQEPRLQAKRHSQTADCSTSVEAMHYKLSVFSWLILVKNDNLSARSPSSKFAFWLYVVPDASFM